ncbi:hypothetical protein ACOSQ2_024130 [Xanthoceras sorbifolium]
MMIKVLKGLVEVAKAKAILEGIQLVVDDDLCVVVVESDTLNVIKLCTGEVVSRCEVDDVIHDIQLLAGRHGFSSFSFVPVCSKVAHCVARWTVCSSLSTFWLLSFPNWLNKLILDDKDFSYRG